MAVKKKQQQRKARREEYLGSGAEAKVYAVSPKRVKRVMHVNDAWKAKNKKVLTLLRKLARSKNKPKYLCPIYGVSIRKRARGGATVTIVMARARHTSKSWAAAYSVPFRRMVKEECEDLGIEPPTDWHGFNVMQLGKRIVRIDYFPWYMAKEPDWMVDAKKDKLEYGVM